MDHRGMLFLHLLHGHEDTDILYIFEIRKKPLQLFLTIYWAFHKNVPLVSTFGYLEHPVYVETSFSMIHSNPHNLYIWSFFLSPMVKAYYLGYEKQF